MLKFEVHCKGCVFAEVKDGLQIGCYLKNIQKFEKTYEDGYFIINRRCNSHRDQKWLKENKDDNPYERVGQENRIRLGYAINFIGSYDEDLFEKTVKSLDNPSYVVVVNDRPEHNKRLFEIAQRETKLHQTRINIVQIINQKEEYYIDEAFRNAKNGFFCWLKSGDTLPRRFYERLDNAINVNMEVVSVCLGDNFLLFQSTLFKHLEGNKSRMLEDGSIENKTFLEKIKTFEDYEKCVRKWSDIS